MKRKIVVITLSVLMMILLAGCSEKEVTLNLSFGDRTGNYFGEMLDGVPHGLGKFTTVNSDGRGWTYEGEFKNGHFEGEGITTWDAGQKEIGTYKNDVIVPKKGDELKTLYTSPEDFKYHCVEIIGRVFAAPEYDEDGVAFQMWGDVENSENNTVVWVGDPDFKISQGDYVKVIGIVSDTLKGENAFGVEVIAPTVAAKEYSIVSYQEALAPAHDMLIIDETQTQLGYGVTIQKIELADKETRVYVKVENNGNSKFNLYSFNSKITQNGKQFEEQNNWESDYPEIQTDLLVGNTTEGIIVFPPIEQGSFKVIFDGSSNAYQEKIEDYVFEIKR